MKRHSSAASLALFVLAVLGISAPAAAGELVPLRARFEGSFTVTPVNPPSTIFDIRTSATGNASHFGRFTMERLGRIDRSTATLVGTASFTLKAANGDTVYGTGTGQASPTPTPGVLASVETYTITGGTGRFAGATGAFVVQRLTNKITLTDTGTLTGSISSPGAANP